MQSYCQKGRICTDLGAWSVTATDAAQAAAPQTVAQAVGHSEGTWFSHSLSNTERKILRSLWMSKDKGRAGKVWVCFYVEEAEAPSSGVVPCWSMLCYSCPLLGSLLNHPTQLPSSEISQRRNSVLPMLCGPVALELELRCIHTDGNWGTEKPWRIGRRFWCTWHKSIWQGHSLVGICQTTGCGNAATGACKPLPSLSHHSKLGTVLQSTGGFAAS